MLGWSRRVGEGARARDAHEPRRRRVPLAPLRWAARATLVVLCAATLAWLTRSTWMAPLVGRLAGDALGARVTIASLESTGLRTFDATGVHATSENGGWTVTAERARIRIHPWTLARRGVAGIERIEIEGLDVEADLASPHASARPRPGSSVATWNAPFEVPELDVKGAHVALETAPGAKVELEGLAVRVTHERLAASTGAIAVEHVASTDARFAFDERSLDARVVLERGVLWIPRVAAGDRTLVADGRIDLGALARGRGDWQVSVPELAARARGTLTAQELDGVVDVAAFDLARLPSVTRTLPIDLEGVVSGSVELAWPFRAVDALAMRATLAVSRPCAFGRSFDQVELDGGVAGGILLVDRFVASRASTSPRREPDDDRDPTHASLDGRDVIAARDVELPLRADDLEQRLRAARGTIEVDVRDVPGLVAPWLRLAGAVPEHRLALAARFDASGVAIDRALLRTSGGELVVREGRFEWAPHGRGGPDALARTKVDLAANVAFDDLATVGKLFSVRPWSGRLRGVVEAHGEMRAPSGVANLRGERVVVHGVAIGDCELVARVDPDRVKVETLTARTPYGALEASGVYRIDDAALDDAKLELRANERAHAWTKWLSTGGMRLAARLSGPLERLDGAIELDANEVRVRETLLDAVALRGELHDGRLRVHQLSACAEDVELDVAGEIAARGIAPPYSVRLDSLGFVHGDRSLALEAPVELEIGPELVRMTRASLSGTAGRVRAFGELAGERWNAHVDVDHLCEPGLLALLRGYPMTCEEMDGTLDLAGDGRAFSAEVELEIAHMRLPDAGAGELAFRARAGWHDELLTIDRLAIEGDDDRLEITGSLPLDLRSLPAASSLRDGELALRVEMALAHPALLTSWPGWPRSAPRVAGGRLEGDVAIDGTWARPRAKISIAALGVGVTDVEPLGRVARAAAAWTSLGTADLRAEIELGDELECKSFRADGAEGVFVDLTGRAALPFRPREWIEGRVPDWKAIDVDGSARLHVPDAATLAEWANVAEWAPIVRRVQGTVSAELDVRGKAGAPELTGELDLEDGELRLEADVPPLGALRGRVTVAGTRATLEHFTGELGAGPFALEGTFDWAAKGRPVRLAMKGEQLLIARTESLRLRADADLLLEGELDGPPGSRKITGELRLRDSRYARDFDLLGRLRELGRARIATGRRGITLFSLAQEPLASTELDVRVRGENFRIVNNLVRAELRPELSLVGTGREPDLDGRLFVGRGAVVLPAGILDLTSGSIAFTPQDPLVPILDVHGEARLAGYDVTLWARGAYDDLELLLSSSPALPSSDLVLLALSGRVPTNGRDGEAGRQTAQVLATYLGRDYLTRALDDDAGAGESLWSRLEIRQGSEITRNGGQTTEVRLELGGRGEDARRGIILRGEHDAYDRTNIGLRFVFRSK